jgi:hypothetical protein
MRQSIGVFLFTLRAAIRHGVFCFRGFLKNITKHVDAEITLDALQSPQSTQSPHSSEVRKQGRGAHISCGFSLHLIINMGHCVKFTQSRVTARNAAAIAQMTQADV